MDPTSNPFAPGAGTRPPELAGRDDIVEAARVTLARVRTGRPAKSQMLLGLRGTGKTVLLNRIDELAETQGYQTMMLEAPEDQRLAEMLVPALRQVLYRLSGVRQARNLANRGLGILRAFASVFRVKYGDFEIGVEPQVRGTADSGNLEADLPELLLTVAEAARAAERPVALLMDEVQYLTTEDLRALIVSMHRIGQRGLPLIVFGAGLPQLAALAGNAKSYAERLFDYPPVGPLTPEAAGRAIQEPLREQGVQIRRNALRSIIERTQCYPYFLQEWGSHAWNTAASSVITLGDVEQGTQRALEALDKGFFRVRLDRLTPRERDYLRAMAELGPGPHRSGDIASALRMDVTAAGPLRSGLIRKGMIYSPAHGDTAFTVPMFDGFMKRAIPEWTPAAAAHGGKPRRR